MKKRTKVIIAVLCVLFVIGCGAGLLLLKKISAAGGVRYLYNLKDKHTQYKPCRVLLLFFEKAY